jgi:hypothetical protein
MIYGAFPYGSAPIGGLAPLLTSETFLEKKLKLYYQNILESATVSVTSENSSYPKYRLYDRLQGLLFKGSSTPSYFDIIADLGSASSYQEIDTLIVPANHNFNGKTVRLYFSDDAYYWYQALAWVASASLTLKTFTPASHRYWLFRIESPSSPPELSELFLTKCLEFERGPSYGYGRGVIENINRLESKSGQAQKTIWGEERKRRNYDLIKLSDTQRNILEMFRTAAYGKNFYIEDLEGNLFFAELPEGLGDFKAEEMNRWGLNLRVQEVLS